MQRRSIPHDAAESLGRVPRYHTPLFGRDELLAALHELRDNEQIVTLVGVGGVGKTRLSVELLQDAHDEGVRVGFVRLGEIGVDDADLVLAAIVEQFAMLRHQDGSAADSVVHRLGTEPTILVLDDFDGVRSAAGFVDELVARCPDLVIVITSRRPLGIDRERCVVVGPLATHGAEHRPAPSAAMFLDRLASDAPLETAHRIARAVGGLPIAVELAAQRARTLGADVVATLLESERGLATLTREGGALGARHRSLRECLAWSYEHLDAHSQATLRAASVFAGPFDLAALSAVCDTAAAAADLAELVGHGLVTTDEGGSDDQPQWRLLPPVREFAAEMLDSEPGERALRVEAHARWCEAVAEEIRDAYDREPTSTAIALMLRHSTNLNGAIANLERRGDTARAMTLVAAVAGPRMQYGWDHAVHRYLREVVADTLPEATQAPIAAQLWAAYYALVGGGATGALIRLRRVVDDARARGDLGTLLTGFELIAVTITLHCDAGAVCAAVDEGVEISGRLGLARRRAEFTAWRGMLMHMAGDLDAARRDGLEAIALARRIGDASLQVRSGLLLSAVAPDEAPTFEQLLDTACAHGTPLDELYVLHHLAVRDAFEGRPEVWERIERGIDLAGRTGWHAGQLVCVFAAAVATTKTDPTFAHQLDAALRADWLPLTTIVPPRSIIGYERRLTSQQLADRDMAAAPALWSDTIGCVLAHAALQRVARPDAPTLSNRELAVVRGLARGLTNKAIAAELGLTPKTVMHYCAALYRKLGVKSRAEAVAVAARIVSLDN